METISWTQDVLRDWLYVAIARADCATERSALLACLKLANGGPRAPSPLTSSERRVVAALQAHPSADTRTLGVILNKSAETIRNQLSASMGKLHVSRRAALVAVDIEEKCSCARCLS